MAKKSSHHANLRAYLKATRQSQREVAKRLGVAESTFSQYLSGKRIPQPDIALRIARACRVPLEVLLTRPQSDGVR